MGREEILSHLVQAGLPVLLSLRTSRPALPASITHRSSGPKTPRAPKGLLQAIKAHSSKVEANQLQETIAAIVQAVEDNPESANKCLIALKNNYFTQPVHEEHIPESSTKVRSISQKFMMTVVLNICDSISKLDLVAMKKLDSKVAHKIFYFQCAAQLEDPVCSHSHAEFMKLYTEKARQLGNRANNLCIMNHIVNWQRFGCYKLSSEHGEPQRFNKVQHINGITVPGIKMKNNNNMIIVFTVLFMC
jgi:hypothetical protein